jgi:putative tryptophan/tyrosine transport system substrate-binding protein
MTPVSSRRGFMIVAVGCLLPTSHWAHAQQAGKIPRIGFLQAFNSENVAAFMQGLGELGYIAGQTAVIETRFYSTMLDRLPQLANELVSLKCDVIFAAAPYAITAVMQATTTIPIVGVDLESDPVASGWAKSLSRPGGHVTGLFLDLPELGGKQIQLLREALPEMSRVAVLWDSTIGEVQFRATESAARAAGVKVQSLPIRRLGDFRQALDRAAAEHVHGMLTLSSPVINAERSHIASLALQHRIPTISLFTLFAESGGLMAYGPNLQEMYRRAAAYVDNILRGATPSSLPIERPTRFEFVVNLKTAKTLGLTIPPALLLRADHVIE